MVSALHSRWIKRHERKSKHKNIGGMEMAKGEQVAKGKILVPYFTKLEKETRDLMHALVSVSELAGQRELLHKMLEYMEKEDPAAFSKARQLLELTRGVSV